jgi:hypothetical protein
MRFFASWWERCAGRVVVPTVLMALAGFGLVGQADAIIKALFGSFGFVWG